MAKGNTEKAYTEIRKQFRTRKNNLNILRWKNGEVIISEGEKAERWKEYTEELYSGKMQGHVLEEEQEGQEDDIGPHIMKEEFDRALNELRRRKAPGPDLMHGEILQAVR